MYRFSGGNKKGGVVILVFNGKGIYDLDLLNLYIRVI